VLQQIDRPLRSQVTDPVTNSPTEQVKARRVIDTPFQVMYIMANMQQNYNDRSAHDASLHDQVLCKLTVDLNGVLEVLPDFSKRGDLPYRITTLEGAIFEYTISHESPPLPKELAAQEQKLLAEMFARKAVSLS
jgi:hypothetical protein